MINLRYHIVSLTAVFLAIGIGLTLGSTFLDRATVENLNGQLESLEARLGERDAEIEDLEGELEETVALQDALDEQGARLLADRLEPVPVVVVAAHGVDEADVAGAVEALQVAGADVQGLWWLTERLLLGNEADIADLGALLEESSEDPARLRRLTVDALGDELSDRQALESDVAAEDDGTEDPAGAGEDTTEETAVDPTLDPEVADPGSEDVPAGEDPGSQGATLSEALTEGGYITFEPVAGGPESPTLPPGVHLVVVGGSPDVPDDLFVTPLVERLVRGADEPTRTVVTSAMGDGAAVSEVVSVIRDDEALRSLVSTVDGLDHFQGWMATVLAVGDLDDDVVGHYGLGDGASALLPPLRTT